MRILIAAALLALALSASSLPAATAQQPAQAASETPPLSAEMAAFIRGHTYPLTIGRGQISGPGAELLLREGASTQFFMLAEYVSHVDHASPLFMAALFDALHRAHGFNYVAVEQDPFGTQLASRPPHRGSVDALAEQARLYPYAFTFVNDEELRMFAAVGRSSTGRWRPIWGVDQVFGATLPLEELRRLAPNAQAREAAERLLQEATRHEVRVPDFGDWRGTRDFTKGHFVSSRSTANMEAFAELRRRFSPRRGSRADELIRGLELSSRIYSYNQRAHERGPNGEPLGYHSNALREQLMKDAFLDNYREAERRDRRLPRVVVKAGTNHLVRGRNFTNIHSLGNMLSEFAITNRMQALTIVLAPVRSEWPSFDKMPGELQTLMQSRDLGATAIVDLRPLRAHLHAGQRFGLTGDALRDLRFLVYGTDFVLFMPSRNGTFSFTAPDAGRAAQPRP